MVIWDQVGNWSQWLWIVWLEKSVKVWQCTSCVAVSWYNKNRLFSLERLKERHTERSFGGWCGGWAGADPPFCLLPAASAGLYKLQLVHMIKAYYYYKTRYWKRVQTKAEPGNVSVIAKYRLWCVNANGGHPLRTKIDDRAINGSY